MIFVLVAQGKNTSIVMGNSDIIQVAVGVILNAKGEVLIAKRQAHKHLGDCWEFPGGKVESTETVQCALARELEEEVGIRVLESSPWLVINHDYGFKKVCLNVYKVTAFEGEPTGLEGQPILWVSPQQLPQLTVPDANKLIVESLQR